MAEPEHRVPSDEFVGMTGEAVAEIFDDAQILVIESEPYDQGLKLLGIIELHRPANRGEVWVPGILADIHAALSALGSRPSAS